MTTYYVDLENGNDANDGLSFANRKKTISAITPSSSDTIRVMASRATTSLGQTATWRSHKLQRTGQVAGTSGISSITGGSGVIVTVTLQANKLGIQGLDLSNGDWIAITGVTGMTTVNGHWQVTSVDTGANTFQLVDSAARVTSSTAVVSSAAMIKISNCVVTLTTPVTKDILDLAPNRTPWTASTNVTTSVVSTLGSTGTPFIHQPDQIVIGATFTTGKAAYKAIGSTLDLSAYSQISFSIIVTAGANSPGNIQIKLCSDTTGTTAVNTFTVPSFNVGSGWYTFTVNNGSALGSSIQSVGLYVTTDLGTQTIQLGQIIACKAPSADDCITLNTLISPSQNSDPYHQIAGIVGSNIFLRKIYSPTNTTTGNPFYVNSGGHFGTAGSSTTYVRQPIVVTPGGLTWLDTSVSNVTYDFGYDRTNMSTQSDYTDLVPANAPTGTTHYFITVRSGQVYNRIGINGVATAFAQPSGYGVLSSLTLNLRGVSNAYTIFTCTQSGNNGNISVTADYIATVAFTGITSNSQTGNIILDIGVLSGLTTSFVTTQSSLNIYGAVGVVITAIDRIEGSLALIGTANSRGQIYNNTTFRNNLVCFAGKGNYFNNCTFTDNWGMSNNPGCVGYFNNCTFSSGNYWDSPQTVSTQTSIVGEFYVKNSEFNGIQPQVVTSIGTQGLVVYGGNNGIYFTNCTGSTAPANGQWREGWTSEAQTAVRHTASGYAWKINPLNTDIVNSNFPVYISLGKIACSANNLVTVKAWMRRSNTGLSMELVCPAYQITGVTTEQASSITASADTWEELTITFTPTQAGVVEIYARAYGGSTYSGYVDDVTITQA